jgi:hypothetical protein
MSSVSTIRFFEAHPVFAIAAPAPFAYGRQPRVDVGNRVLTWFDARSHGIEIARVGESTRDKLVVHDVDGRRFVFEPMTVEFWRSRFPQYAGLDTVEKIVESIRDEPSWG